MLNNNVSELRKIISELIIIHGWLHIHPFAKERLKRNNNFWGNRSRDWISRCLIEEFLMLDVGLASFRKVSRSPRNQAEPTKIRNPAGRGLSCSAPSFTLIQKATVGRHNWFHRRIPVLSGYMFLRITARSPRHNLCYIVTPPPSPDLSLDYTRFVMSLNHYLLYTFVKLL